MIVMAQVIDWNMSWYSIGFCWAPNIITRSLDPISYLTLNFLVGLEFWSKLQASYPQLSATLMGVHMWVKIHTK